MSEHTKEPWRVATASEASNPYIIVDGEKGLSIADCDCPFTESEANARRIVACVNACAGITIEALEGDKIIWVSESDHSHLEQQRDELLAAAKKAIAECCDLTATEAGNALEAAISKAEANQ